MREYQIIGTEYHVEDLMILVNEAIKEGWKPQGGVAISVEKVDPFTYRKIFYQAMIREQE